MERVFLIGCDYVKIGFIGAGKVGTAFGMYLKSKGFNIFGYYSKTLESAEKAASLTNSKVSTELNELIKNIDIIFITTTDDKIQQVCNGLVEKNLLSKGQIIVHMSGAHSSRILEKAKLKACFVYSLHPLQSFAQVEKAVEDLNETVFSIEGDEEKIEIIESILKGTGNKYFKLNSEQKSLYHATACVVSNYLVTLMDYGLSIFESIGIDKMEGYGALFPLIEGTINNIHNLGTEKALTGPIARGDIETIKSHISSFKKINKDSLEIYKLMGLKTVDLAQKGKLKDNQKIKDLKKILKEV
ncbi:Rossmann-like and DUF2520 domain-containing protein [Anaeromicrobium sediminis]|uniref:NADP oxidoreductase n=1 Tax=Anaeromicrobium sediminis TaxID=1478221 RepID=A0A267MQW1_9FIRM|nr:Rossmann-like and DUF2520 domain-containing protein [Anaeromicrobium sediminis]PAB61120.1 hypothetical protein CCE28_01450 [Anaeromicrobium sediminis]